MKTISLRILIPSAKLDCGSVSLIYSWLRKPKVTMNDYFGGQTPDMCVVQFLLMLLAG